MVLSEGVKGQLAAWRADARLQGCQPGTAAWRWAPSKTTNFMSLIQHFLFVLILSPVLEAHGAQSDTEQRAGALGTQGEGEALQGFSPVWRSLGCAPGQLARGLRSNAPGHPVRCAPPQEVPRFWVLVMDSWLSGPPAPL